MKVLLVSVEMTPLAKVGGLADVVGALPKALRALGTDARVIMPLYAMIENDSRWPLTTEIESFEVEVGPGWTKTATLKSGEVDGIPVWFIGTDEWFNLAHDSETVYQPGGDQHLFFSAAVIAACDLLKWHPDVLHCHDWHTGLLPVLLREKAGPQWDSVGCLYTIHNQAYQGEFDISVLDRLGLSRDLFTAEKLETWGRVNFLKSGMVYSDCVNTVSRTYAQEIQTAEYGCTLEGLMKHLAQQGRLFGILNGIDTEVFNPAADPNIPAKFDAAKPEKKAVCRTKLLKELDMKPLAGAPLVGMVSRLSGQKGMDLVLEAAEAILDLPCQLVVMGLGDPNLADGFRDLEKRQPGRFRFLNEFNAPLGQRIYAGCDAFLMPSNFEPCGLGQLIAMRYGTVPVVRATGGLVDTVADAVNGFVFRRRGAMEMLAAIERMHAAFQDRAGWSELVHNGMTADHGWERSAHEYVELYENCRDQRVARSA